MVRDHTPPNRQAKLGDLPLFELEEFELALDEVHAIKSINEARKPQYHGLKREEYADLDTAANRQRIDRYQVLWLGELVVAHPRKTHPAVFEYQEEGKRTAYHIAMTAVEAMLLGRSGDLFPVEEVDNTRRCIEHLRRGTPLASQYPDARWPLLELYRTEYVDRRKDANKRLYDSSRYRYSNGEEAALASRIEHVKEVREKVLHPVLETVTQVAGWDQRERWLMHRVVDYRLFFHGTGEQRNHEWLDWYGRLDKYYEIKQYYFDEAIREGKPADLPKRRRRSYV